MSKDVLFTPLRLGAIQIPNRIIMAPLTRMRAGANNVPTPLNEHETGGNDPDALAPLRSNSDRETSGSLA